MAMTPFEKMAIFSVLDTLENQIKGLKALIATSNNDVTNQPNRTAQEPMEAPNHSHYTSEEEEAHLDRMMETARLETEKLAGDAEVIHQNLFEETAAELRG